MSWYILVHCSSHLNQSSQFAWLAEVVNVMDDIGVLLEPLQSLRAISLANPGRAIATMWWSVLVSR